MDMMETKYCYVRLLIIVILDYGFVVIVKKKRSRVHWGKLGHEVKWDIELWAPMIFLNTNSAMEFYYYRSFQYVSYNLVYIAAYEPFLYRYNSLYKIKHHTNIRSLRKRTKLFPIESPC